MPVALPPTTLRRAAPFALAVGLAAALTAPAAAYVRTRSPDGKFPLLWSDPHITMTLRLSGAQVVSPADFIGAARRSAATWSDPALSSSLAFTIDAASDAPPGTHFDQVNAVSFRTDSWNAPMYPEQALALTTVWSQGSQIVDADTEINAVDPRFQWGVLPDDPTQAAMAAEVDLQNALTHELGHVIGLSHPCTLADPPARPETDDEGAPVLSCSDPALPASVRDATMFPSSEPGSIAERTLSPDEIKAVHDLYPLRATAPALLGDRSGGCGMAAAGEPGASAAAALSIAMLLARRRRAPTR